MLMEAEHASFKDRAPVGERSRTVFHFKTGPRSVSAAEPYFISSRSPVGERSRTVKLQFPG